MIPIINTWHECETCKTKICEDTTCACIQCQQKDILTFLKTDEKRQLWLEFQRSVIESWLTMTTDEYQVKQVIYHKLQTFKRSKTIEIKKP